MTNCPSPSSTRVGAPPSTYLPLSLRGRWSIFATRRACRWACGSIAQWLQRVGSFMSAYSILESTSSAVTIQTSFAKPSRTTTPPTLKHLMEHPSTVIEPLPTSSRWSLAYPLVSRKMASHIKNWKRLKRTVTTSQRVLPTSARQSWSRIPPSG